MGLEEGYQEKVERISSSMENATSRRKVSRAKTVLDRVMPIALLSLTFVILFSFFIPLTETLAVYINYLNWAVIIYFTARLAVELRLSRHRERFLQNHLLDFMLVIPAFSVLREVKILKLIGEIDLFSEEAAVSAAFFKEASIATQMTRITRIIKKSLGF